MHLWNTHSLQSVTITRGEGCTVWDAAGKPYLDMLSGVWCTVLGHGHPRWVSAVQEQLSVLTHVGWAFATPAISDGLSKLAEILTPALNRAVFLNTGSEAVELGLKMALAATGGDEVVVIERGYYGATTGALALSEFGRNATYLPSLRKVHRLPLPDCQRCPAGCAGSCDGKFPCLNVLAELAERTDKRIAAVLYEPVLGSGVFVLPNGYGERLRDLASRCGALLIAEEVTTGMGRTGRWFGFEYDQIVPDILLIGKVIGAGLPVSVVVSTEDVEARCQGIMGSHVQSHQNDPFSGRIVATVISIMQDEHLVERAADRGNYLMARLRELQEIGPWIREVRGRGMMVGVELHQPWAGKGSAIARRLLEAGFIMDFHLPSATFRIFPPYVIATEELDLFLRAFKQALLEQDADQGAQSHG